MEGFPTFNADIVSGMVKKNSFLVDILLSIVARIGLAENTLTGDALTEVCPDGSSRRFYRIRISDDTSLIAVVPSSKSPRAKAEAIAAWKIGSHLEGSNVPVPSIAHFEEDEAILIYEDLGDTRLYDFAHPKTLTPRIEQKVLYSEAIKNLVRMQVEGVNGFDSSWCWDSPRYDQKLMLERESHYFYQSLCLDYFNCECDQTVLFEEFEILADQAAAAPARFFLHRDFQSRNIMVKDGRVRFIDYQGGRLGPLGYDLASLLIDPYVGLSAGLQDELFQLYIHELVHYVSYDPDQFEREYRILAIQRNLQILGAFAFLTLQRQKPFFQTYIQPALFSLQTLLEKQQTGEYPVLGQLTEECLKKVRDDN